MGVERTLGDELVLKAYVESGIGVGSECHSLLACEIFGLPVFIAHCVLNL